jgi:hypothetical protein
MANDITITLEGLPELINALQGIPGGARFAVQQSTKKALGGARTIIDRAVRARYAIGQQAVLSKISRPQFGAIGGKIEVKDKRFALSMFPSHDVYPAGVLVDFLRSTPSRYAHAFTIERARLPGAKSDPIVHRVGDARYPIAGAAAPESVPEMVASSKVLPGIEEKINSALYKEMARLMQGVLSGAIKVPSYYAK